MASEKPEAKATRKPENEIPGVEGDLVAAVLKADAAKFEAALASGANPNIKLCNLQTVNYRTYYGLSSNPKCTGTHQSSILELVLQRAYIKQPALIAALGKYHAQWGVSADEVLSTLANSTIMYDQRKSVAEYLDDKIVVAKALHDAGFVFTREAIAKNAQRFQDLKNATSVSLVKAIAEFSNAMDAFNDGLRNEVAARERSESARRTEQDKTNQAYAKIAQMTVDARRERLAKVLPVVKSIGQQVCKNIDGTTRQILFHSSQGPAYGADTPAKFAITAFTESVAPNTNRIQLRIAGIIRTDLRRPENFEQLEGKVVMRVGSVLWDDAENWEPCD